MAQQLSPAMKDAMRRFSASWATLTTNGVYQKTADALCLRELLEIRTQPLRANRFQYRLTDKGEKYQASCTVKDEGVV